MAVPTRDAGRAVVERNWALLPREGIPESVLPEWTSTKARVLAGPPLGARFAEYLLDVAPGGGTEQALPPHVESFVFVLEGEAHVDVNGLGHRLGPGGYVFLSPGARFGLLTRTEPARVLWLKKAYEPFEALRPHDLAGDEDLVASEPFMGIPAVQLRKLLPEDAGWDMAMNILTFEPGHGLPFTETHVMEHGLYLLQGGGEYYLGDRWVGVRAGDFIWMGPWCPQNFVADGPEPARYLYYKNVNRDVEV